MKSPLGAAVYVSYAWGDKQSAEAVEQLRNRFEDTYVTFKPDKYALKAGDSFSQFISEIGRANCIIVLFSEAYFQSFYCMLELAKIIAHSKAQAAPDKLEEHLMSRVIGIQVSDLNSSCIHKKAIETILASADQAKEFVRIDGDESKAISQSAQIRVSNIPYNSESDQQLILDSFDTFSDVFGTKLNYTSIDDDCFTTIIQKSRLSLIKQLQSNKLFREASEGICEKTATALDAVLQTHLSPEEVVGLNINEQKVACLLTMPQEILLETLYEAQTSDENNAQYLKSSIANLLMRLLPMFCQHEYTDRVYQTLTARMSGNQASINTRFALPISVENMMAAIDQREVGFITVPISQRSDEKKLLVDNKYCLYQAPEGGEDSRATYVKDTQQDLLNSIGLSASEFLNLDGKQNNQRLTETRHRLLQDFTKDPERHKSQDLAAQNHAIDKALSKKRLGQKHENPHRYFIVPSDETGSDFWDDYAREVHRISSKLVVIRLNNSATHYEYSEEEEAFFEHIPQLLD